MAAGVLAVQFLWGVRKRVSPRTIGVAPRRAIRIAAVFAFALLTPVAARAHGDDPCGPAIAAAEARNGLPAGLLRAIAEVEAGRIDPRTGVLRPWPWTTNAENQDRFFATRVAAAAWVRGAQARGVVSIDVGCMQVNLRQHPGAFGSVEDAFDPVRNADYAAHFLLRLRAMSVDWTEAVGWYHSHTEALALPYRAEVARSYLENSHARPEPGFAATVMSRRERILHQMAEAWSATVPAGPPAGRAMSWDEAAGARPWAAAAVPPRAVADTATRALPVPARGDARTAAAERLWDATATPPSGARPGVPGREIAAIDAGGS
jgi:hypothetical protein